MKELTFEEKLRLIRRNTAEIIGEEELRTLLRSKKKPVVYLGTAITGKPHIAYFLWILKLSDFLKAGFKVKLLLADVHGALDNTPWELIEHRYNYYAAALKEMMGVCGAHLTDLEIVKGSSFQLKGDYITDLLKLSTKVTVHDARRAASDVVKNTEGDSAKLAGLLYPLMQSLDEEYLGVDVQYGGIDQRKILVFAREHLPQLGYRARVEIMTPLIPSLAENGKMSASNISSKIDLLDSDEDIKKKISRAYCLEGDADNGVMAFMKYVLMVLKEDNDEKFTVVRDKKFGGTVSYKNYSEIEKDFTSKKLHPMDLKNAVSEDLIHILKKIDRKKLVKLAEKAYNEDI